MTLDEKDEAFGDGMMKMRWSPGSQSSGALSPDDARKQTRAERSQVYLKLIWSSKVILRN